MSDALRLHGLLGGKKPTGNAVAGDVRAGKTFSNANGTDVTGTLAVRTGDNVALAISTLGNTFKLRPPAGIYDGVTDMVTHSDANRIAGNIKQGVVLDGITGTMPDGTGMKKFASGSVAVSTAQASFYNISATSYNMAYISSGAVLNFSPSVIVVRATVSNTTFHTIWRAVRMGIGTNSSYDGYCISLSTHATGGTSGQTWSNQGGNLSVTGTGFTLPVDYGGVTYSWEAYA